MSDEPAYLAFIANDVPLSPSETMSAATIGERLIAAGFWAFTESSKVWRRICVGDNILIYLAGPRNRRFIASAIADSVAQEVTKDEAAVLKDLGLVFLSRAVRLRNIRQFQSPVAIRPLVSHLDFITEKKNYGLHLRLPVVRMSEKDFNTVLRAGSAESM